MGNYKYYYSSKSALSITNQADALNIDVYLNPTADFIQLPSELQINKILITNIEGKIVFWQQNNFTDNRINVQHLPNNLYFLKIIDKDGKSGTIQIVKR